MEHFLKDGGIQKHVVSKTSRPSSKASGSSESSGSTSSNAPVVPVPSATSSTNRGGTRPGKSKADKNSTTMQSGQEESGSTGGRGSDTSDRETGSGRGSATLHTAGGGRRPVKVWNSARTVRKALVVATYEEFQRKGREKLGLSANEPLCVVLEGDGTHVDDGEYFQTLPENSIFLFLRSGETWHPAGSDSVRTAVMEAIPTIVCDTLYSLGLHDQTPSWKIMDNKGRLTVVLHWERDEMGTIGSAGLSAIAGPSRQSSTCSTIASGGPRLLGIHTRSISQRSGSSVSSTPCLSRDNSRTSGGGPTSIQSSMLVQTSFDSHLPSTAAGIHSVITKDGKRETTINDHYLPSQGGKVAGFGPHITVINHDVESKVVGGGGFLGLPHHRGSSGSSIIMGAPSPRQLSRQGSSVESAAIVPIHHHTAECSAAGRSLHQPTEHSKHGSPTSNECDFHCCTLHASHLTHKSVATSPIQQQTDGQEGKRSLSKGAHVRFSHIEVDEAAQGASMGTITSTANAQTASSLPSNGASTTTLTCSTAGPRIHRDEDDDIDEEEEDEDDDQDQQQHRDSATISSLQGEPSILASGMRQGKVGGGGGNGDSSESETENNEDTCTTDKFLLLVDQLSLEQPRHLSIKDIGIILDRLNSKVIDVEMLERSIEATDTHNWTIKATIRGEVMRELGVIYNSNYYAISEHPSYGEDEVAEDGAGGGDGLDNGLDVEDEDQMMPPPPTTTTNTTAITTSSRSSQ